MAIAYVNAGSIQRATAQTSRSPTLPASRVNGNILIAACVSKNNASHTWSGTGWTKIGSNVNSGASFTSSIGWRIVDGSEGQPTISWTGSADAAAIIWQLSGTSATQPFSNINTNAGTTSTHSATGITGTAAGSWALYIDNAAANTGLATPASWTERSDVGDATVVSRFTLGNRSIGTGSSGNISVTGANAAWTMRIFELLQQAYTLAVAQQTYTLTGNATGLYRGYKVAVTEQTYTATANDVTLSKSTSGYTLPVTSASYVVTGNSTSLLWKRVLPVTKATYTATAQAVGLLFKRVLPVTKQSYSVTGNAVGLLWKRVLGVTKQSYTVTAQTITPLWKRVLSVASQSYTVTAQSIVLLWKRVLSVAKQTYTLTGNDVTLTPSGTSPTLSVSTQSYTTTGNSVNLLRGYSLPITPEAYTVTGQNVSLTRTYELACETQTYTTTFEDVTLTYSGIVGVDGDLYLDALMPYQVYLTESPHRITLKEYKVNGAVLVELSDSLTLEERMLNNVMLFEEKWII